jgi:mRNA-degrading endonuclease RelE of RelBE toxin-antitoxin system
VDWPNRAQRDLRRLAEQDRQRVVDAVDDYAATGRGDVTRLRARQREWRLRVGEIRVVFTLDQAARRLRVLSVDPRGGAYR